MDLVRILQEEIGWDMRLYAVLLFAKFALSDLSFSPSLMFWRAGKEVKHRSDNLSVYSNLSVGSSHTDLQREARFHLQPVS